MVFCCWFFYIFFFGYFWFIFCCWFFLLTTFRCSNNFKNFKKYPDTFRLLYDQGKTSNQHNNKKLNKVGEDLRNPQKLNPFNKNGTISSFQKRVKIPRNKNCTISEKGQNSSIKMVKNGQNSSIKKYHFSEGSKFLNKDSTISEKYQNSLTKMTSFLKRVKFLNKNGTISEKCQTPSTKMIPFLKRVKIPQHKWYHFRKGSKIPKKWNHFRKWSKFLNKIGTILSREGSKFLDKNGFISVRKWS